MKSLFFGGVHPEERKELSASAPLTALAVVHLRQHIGAICKSLVAVGDMVCMGQKLGDGDGLCVPVHTPVSGVVVGIEDRPHPGGVCSAILIRNDLLSPERVVIGMEDNKPEAAALLKEYPGMELKVLPTRYPQEAEKQLIQAVTGR